MDNGITYMVLVLLNCLLSMIFEIFEGGQLMSEVSAVEEPVYLAYFDEDNFLSPHYQSLRKINAFQPTVHSTLTPAQKRTRSTSPSTPAKRTRVEGTPPPPPTPESPESPSLSALRRKVRDQGVLWEAIPAATRKSTRGRGRGRPPKRGRGRGRGRVEVMAALGTAAARSMSPFNFS